ncbi:MAG: type III pantothenate kinase [Proteobacteria bacterium]|nr:MAG: type III pantothenate kinase [Pseudomonadota bacterium]
MSQEGQSQSAPPRVLLVDVGNSRIKWRLTGEAYAEGFCPLNVLVGGVPLSWKSLPMPRWVMVSQVSENSLRDDMRRWCAEKWSIEPRFVEATQKVPGVENRYSNVRQLGVDRWLAIVAARRLGEDPAAVIDCGTAITMDLVNRDGDFLGGMILPGRRMFESSFRQRVPYLDPASKTDPVFPSTNTADAIALGIRTALVASIDRFVENAGKLLGETPVLRFTGGDGRWLRGLCTRDASVHQNLVLDGLQILMELDS